MSGKRRLKRKRENVKAGAIIVKGYMKVGFTDEEGTWRGWRVHADPRDDRVAVRIVKGH